MRISRPTTSVMILIACWYVSSPNRYLVLVWMMMLDLCCSPCPERRAPTDWSSSVILTGLPAGLPAEPLTPVAWRSRSRAACSRATCSFMAAGDGMSGWPICGP